MKRTTSLLIAFVLVVSCLSALAFTASADDYEYVDFRPVDADGGAIFSAEGATVETDSNGTAVITLTATSATVSMVYKTDSAIYVEAYANMAVAKYIKHFYTLSSSAMTIDILAKYDRGNKNNADLYLSGMKANPGYFKTSGTGTLEGASSFYGVWDMYQYLSERDGYLPADNIIKFSNITYTIGGAIGDVFTLYNYEADGDYDEDFGTVIPDSGIVDVSDEPSSEEPSEEDPPVEGGVNLAANKPYTVTLTGVGESNYGYSADGDGGCGDGDNGERQRLTNGVVGDRGDGWMIAGAFKAEQAEIVIDLGAAKSISGFSFDQFYEFWGVVCAKSVEYQYSTDGTNYTSAGVVNFADAANKAVNPEFTGKCADFAVTLSTPVTAQYVKVIALADAGTYIWGSEIQVFEAAAEDEPTPPTGDAGMIALAVVSVIALAGAVVIKKR